MGGLRGLGGIKRGMPLVTLHLSRRNDLRDDRTVGLRVGPRAARSTPSRLYAALTAGFLGLAALGALSAAPAVAVGLPRPGIMGSGDLLTVAYDDGAGGTVTRTLACGSEGMADVEEQDACRQLDGLGGPLAPVPTGQMCSMIYGGPQTAHVTGVWHGAPVDETYRRTDGCEVARWNRMVPALPSPASGANGGPHVFAA